MFLKMVTYDSFKGDGLRFDEYVSSAKSFEELIEIIKSRFLDLIDNRDLIINREGDFTNIIETHSRRTVESFVMVYPSNTDLENGKNGITLLDQIFYDPDSQDISNGINATSFWEMLCDEDDEILVAWGLTDIRENQPPQLDGENFGTDGMLYDLELAKFIFELFESSLSNRER